MSTQKIDEINENQNDDFSYGLPPPSVLKKLLNDVESPISTIQIDGVTDKVKPFMPSIKIMNVLLDFNKHNAELRLVKPSGKYKFINCIVSIDRIEIAANGLLMRISKDEREDDTDYLLYQIEDGEMVDIYGGTAAYSIRCKLFKLDDYSPFNYFLAFS